VERGDVLLDRVFLGALDGLGLERGDEEQVAAVVALGDAEIRDPREDLLAPLVARRRIAEPYAEGLPVARDAAVADVLFAQKGSHIAAEALEPLGGSRRHVDL